jgi:hypothetical protein
MYFDFKKTLIFVSKVSMSLCVSHQSQEKSTGSYNPAGLLPVTKAFFTTPRLT